MVRCDTTRRRELEHVEELRALHRVLEIGQDPSSAYARFLVAIALLRRWTGCIITSVHPDVMRLFFGPTPTLHRTSMAVAWFNKDLKLFPIDGDQAAWDFLELTPEERRWVKSAARELHRELGIARAA